MMGSQSKVHFFKVPIVRYKLAIGKLDQLTTSCGIMVFRGSATDGQDLVEQVLRGGIVTSSEAKITIEYEGETVTCNSCRRTINFRRAPKNERWWRR